MIDRPVQCGQAWMAVFFFASYTCLVTFVILNLFVAVVLEGFDDSSVGTEELVLEKCVALWKTYDPNLTMKLPWRKATSFIEQAVQELKVKKRGSTKEDSEMRFMVQQAEVSKLRIDIEGYVSFKSAALATVRLLMPD